MKLRKIKHRSGKFFGWIEDGWARLGGRWGKKSSYDHFSGLGNPGGRTVAEIRDADARRILEANDARH